MEVCSGHMMTAFKNKMCIRDRNVNVKLPLGVMTVIAGVAGSGKSSLMEYFTSQYPGEVISIRQKDIGIN